MEFRNAFAPGSVAYGYDGSLWVAHADGRDERLPVPAMYPYDPDEECVTWPKEELYFVKMRGVQYAVIAKTMRLACLAIKTCERLKLRDN